MKGGQTIRAENGERSIGSKGAEKGVGKLTKPGVAFRGTGQLGPRPIQKEGRVHEAAMAGLVLQGVDAVDQKEAFGQFVAAHGRLEPKKGPIRFPRRGERNTSRKKEEPRGDLLH